MLILHKNICCDPKPEPSHWDGSYEGSQQMVSMRNKKKYPSIIIKYPLFSTALRITILADCLMWQLLLQLIRSAGKAYVALVCGLVWSLLLRILSETHSYRHIHPSGDLFMVCLLFWWYHSSWKQEKKHMKIYGISVSKHSMIFRSSCKQCQSIRHHIYLLIRLHSPWTWSQVCVSVFCDSSIRCFFFSYKIIPKI